MGSTCVGFMMADPADDYVGMEVAVAENAVDVWTGFLDIVYEDTHS